MSRQLYCPCCREPVWDGPYGHKLAKCWGCGIAFDTMDVEEGDPRITRKEVAPASQS